MVEHKTPKEKKSGRKINLGQHKKAIISGGLIAVIAIAGLFTGLIIWEQQQKEDIEVVFSMPVFTGLEFIDTLEYFFPFSESAAIINQIAESLLDFKVTDEGTEFIGNLAENWTWSSDGLELTCGLRRGVQFHDETPFNASAVKWNFDRINRSLNDMFYPYLWFHADGVRVLNETIILDDYTVKFVLNRPYVPFEALLCCSQAYILSPDSTPFDSFVELEDGLIGTGPFKYESSPRTYDPIFPDVFTNINTTLIANSKYWGGKPNFDKLFFKVYENASLILDDMLSGVMDFASLWPNKPENYTSEDGFSIKNSTSQDINYITMDNSVINATMRKAISYALDYDRLLAIMDPNWEIGVIRCRSPLSYGQLYSNWTAFNVPILNISNARQTLLDVNWPGTENLTADNDVSPGNDWEIVANSSTPLALYNISYPLLNPTRSKIAFMFHNNLTQLGIKVEPLGVTGPEYRPWNPVSQFYLLGWVPDINDPSDSINALFSNKIDGHSNYNHVNDTLSQQWMEEALIETNKTAREQLYYQIQERLIEEVFPYIWYYTPLGAMVHPDRLGIVDYLTFPYKFLIKDMYFNY